MTEKLNQRLQAIARTAKTKAKYSGIIQWPKDSRAAPNSILRSALFGIIKQGDRAFLKDIIVASWKGATINYTGQQLDQSDFDVWLSVTHINKSHNIFGKIPLQKTEYQILRLLGKTTGKTDYQWLRSSISRLKACEVKIQDGPHIYAGSFIDEYYRNNNTGELIIIINDKLMSLFTAGFTHFPWNSRKELGRNQLGKWFLGYIESQKSPHFIGLQKLKKLSNSSCNDRVFKQQIKKQLSLLVNALIVRDWIIDKNNILRLHKRIKPCG